MKQIHVLEDDSNKDNHEVNSTKPESNLITQQSPIKTPFLKSNINDVSQKKIASMNHTRSDNFSKQFDFDKT